MVMIMRKLSTVFACLAVLLLCAMCAVTGYAYRSMLCAIEHGGASAPAYVSLIWALPFLPPALLCAVVSFKLRGKGKSK